MTVDKQFWVLPISLMPWAAHADAIRDITTSPNYTNTYDVRNILGPQTAGHLRDTLRSDRWSQTYGEPQTNQGIVNLPALIRATQTLLQKLGMHPNPADGHMGPRTHQAILRYQQQNQLTPTGAPSPELWYHLDSQVKEQQNTQAAEKKTTSNE